MRPYLAAARRRAWLIAAVLTLLWGAGIVSALREYTSTFESQATIWVLRPSPELTNFDPQDPGTPIVQTVASQQTELLQQLLQTDSFVREVTQATSQRAALAATTDERAFLQQIRKRFDVETLGTNMLRVSYTASDPRTPVEMVNAALEVRTDRVMRARVTSTAAVGTLYRREYEVAHAQATAAGAELDKFNASHPAPMSPADQAHQGQLQLAADFAQSRLAELRGRADRAAVAAAVLEMSGLEFQVVDEPTAQNTPSGGGRAAAMALVLAFAAGVLLSALLIVATALLGEPLQAERAPEAATTLIAPRRAEA
jgi:hypothetical protein